MNIKIRNTKSRFDNWSKNINRVDINWKLKNSTIRINRANKDKKINILSTSINIININQKTKNWNINKNKKEE